MEADAVRRSSCAELRCCECGALAGDANVEFSCAACGELLEVVYPDWDTGAVPFSPGDLKQIWIQRRSSNTVLDRSGVWRFRELLPILPPDCDVVSLGEGNTPLYSLPQSARRLGMQFLYAKHQGMNPTGSFKDTGMTAALSIASERGYEWVVCASTGNTAASMAAYAARSGLKALVIIPQGKIAWGKLCQSLEYGAVTLQLNTDFDGCLHVVTDLVRRIPIYLLNSINPYRLEGQKTMAVELMEQLDWNPPDHIIVPGGNLGNSSALGKGLREMHRLGLIRRLPKLSVIQAEGANALYRCMHDHAGRRLVPAPAETLATAIRIGSPASWKKAVRVLQETGGVCEQVSEEEIALAKSEIGMEGLGCEPASAVTLAGLKKLRARGFVSATDTAVLVLTGHVLKDPEYSLKFHAGDLFPHAGPELQAQRHAPRQVEANVEAVLALLQDLRRMG